MTQDQKQLNPELERFFEKQRESLDVVKTTQTRGGQTLDWIPVESQVEGGTMASPPPNAEMPALDKNHKLATFELQEPGAEIGPAGTVPVVRPTLKGLTEKVDMKTFLTKKGGLTVNRSEARKNGIQSHTAAPDPFGYFHATSGQSGTFYGCDGWLNVWDPTVNGSQDHSIMQCGLQNYDNRPNTHSIEAGWTVDKGLNGDTIAHLFTYYTNNGYKQDGNNKGGYNLRYKGWKQYDPHIYPGARINGVSTQGGQQLGISIKFQLWQGNWWFSVQNIWLGYYPASLFGNGIANHASWIGFWGEVYSSLANPNLTKDQMGSGRKAEAGANHACFLSNLRNQTGTGGGMTAHNGSPSAEAPALYDIVPHMNSGTGLGSYFYAGGQAR